MFQTDQRASGHGAQRLGRHPNGQAGLLGDESIDSSQEGPAAAEHHAVFDQVGGQVGAATVQRGLDRLQDGLQRIGQGLADLFAGDGRLAGQAAYQVQPADFLHLLLVQRKRASDIDSQSFGRGQADSQAVVSAEVIDDGPVHFVAAGADGVAGHHVGQAHHGHLGGAAANVADHAGDRFSHRQSHADGGRLGLGQEENLPGARAMRAVEDRPFLHRGDAAGYGHQHTGFQPQPRPLCLAEEIAEHRLAELEVGDHPVAQRADDRDRVRGSPQHLPGQVPYRATAGEDAVGPLLNGHHRRLVEHKPLADDADQRVGRSQVNRKIGTKVSEDSIEHPCSSIGGRAGKSLRSSVRRPDAAVVGRPAADNRRRTIPGRKRINQNRAGYRWRVALQLEFVLLHVEIQHDDAQHDGQHRR